MKVGVVALQGDVSEHLAALEEALRQEGKGGSSLPVRRRSDLERISALVIPGGESTTISKLLVKFGLFDDVRERGLDGMPIMGTCAGCILLAKEGDGQVEGTGTKLLALMDMAVDRNAFGRQRESFEGELDVEGIGRFRAVFIRGPAITRTWGKCRPLARLPGGPVVMARQDHLLGLAFHPELSGDLRIHRTFVGLL